MAIGDTFPYSVPAVGSAGPGFAQQVNNILQEAIDRLSVKVPLSAIDFNSTANLAGSPLLNVGYITLANSISSPAASPVNRLTAFNGDFWYVSPSGPIQLTTGSSLNAAGIGGITGDYGGGNPAQFRFVDSDQRFNAYDDFGTGTWAFLRARAFDIAAGATSAVTARLSFAGSVNRTYTLPTAPASTADPRPLYMTSTGQITVGHSAKIFRSAAVGALPASGSFADLSVTELLNGRVGNTNAAQQTFVKGLDNLPEGLVITAVSVGITKQTTALTSFSLLRVINGGAPVSLGSQSSTSTGAQFISFTLGAPETVSAGTSYSVIIGLNGSLVDKWSDVTITGNIPS